MNSLPPAPKAIGNYVTFKHFDKFIYTSGHIPVTEDKKFIGKVPTQISIETAYEAASLCAELTLSTLKNHVDISKITPVNIVGFINTDNDFMEHAKVLNGFTDKLSEYFDEKSTRSAVVVASLPLNVCVEVQCVFIHE